jgi:23S rRNA pseudoU1915 N3-methylase RlmH
LKFLFLTASHRLPDWLETVTEDYSHRLSHWTATELKICKPHSSPRENNGKKRFEESRILEENLKEDDFVIACDERGKNSFNGAIRGSIGAGFGLGEKERGHICRGGSLRA